MTKKQKSIYYFIIFIVLISIIIAVFVNAFTNKNQIKDIYNIENASDYTKSVNAKAIAVFEEYPLDNFKGIDFKTDSTYLYRTESDIQGSNNFQATKVADSLNQFTIQSNSDESIIDQEKFDNILSSIFENNYKNLDINYFHGLNKATQFTNKKQEYISSYSKNKGIKLTSSGYLVNFQDAYETIFDINNVEATNWNGLFSNPANKIKKVTGIKFVDNKYFYLLVDLENVESFDKDSLKNTDLVINKENYKADLVDIINNKGKSILVLKLHDNIGKFIENRFVDISFNFLYKKTYRVPESALVKNNGLDGLYYVDEDNKIQFSPVKVITDYEGKKIVSNDFEQIYIENNKYKQLRNFSKIIINPSEYKIGDTKQIY